VSHFDHVQRRIHGARLRAHRAPAAPRRHHLLLALRVHCGGQGACLPLSRHGAQATAAVGGR